MKNIFPNIDPIAYYCPFGQYIHLNNYTTETGKNFSLDHIDYSSVKNFSICMHEFQHWLDHHATLWGINNLLSVFNAYSAKESHNEYNFHYVRKLSMELKKESFKDYYSDKIRNHIGSFKKPWRCEYSTGIRFDYEGKVDESKPILFIKFSTIDHKPVIRVPVTILTLLETKAMYSECKMRMAYLSGLKEMEKPIEHQMFLREAENWLYNSNYCVYNAAAHIASTYFQITDIF